MLALAVALALTLLGGSACQPSGSRPHLVLEDPGAPADLQRACALAEERCSRCHTLERVAHAEIASPAHWQDQVARMRRLAGSAISRRDGDDISRCLVYRSFGAAGLDAMARKGPYP